MAKRKPCPYCHEPQGPGADCGCPCHRKPTRAPKRKTIYDRGQEASRRIFEDYKGIPASDETMRSLLYVAWRRGYDAGKRDAQRGGGRNG